MRIRLNAVVGALAGLLYAVPASGQIAAVVDERGKVVFINADSPAPRRLVTAPAATRSLVRAQPVSLGRPAGTNRVAVASREQLERMAHEAAERHQLDPALVRAIIETESNWNPTAVSRKGALGLMQLVPATAEQMGVSDVFDPEQNLDGGVRHMRRLLERYNGDLDRSLAAYNAGAGAVDRARGIPNISETRAYVQKVTESYFRPGSGRLESWWKMASAIRRMVDERGRVIYTNE